jgi:hypothetical protein
MSIVRRQSAAEGTELTKQTVGNALVVHPAGKMTEGAQALALGVAPDTEHDLVVVDLPVNSPIAMWESVAKALPRRRRGVRLVIGGRSRETSALAGQWLCERLGRTVIAPDGMVIPSAGGSLFVHSGRGSGWVRFHPGREPKWEAKRFPRPSWDSGLTAEMSSTSSRGVAEPLPGGLWIRPVGFDQQQRHHRARLIEGLPPQDDVLTIVLGCPGCPPLTLDDAARLWIRLPENVRQNARFVRYGPMSAPSGTTLGQALADLLGKEISFYAGMPVGSTRSPEVRTVLFDGRLGWPSFARELTYLPRGQAGPDSLPHLISHRVPLPGLTELSPAVYWCAPDAVIEVVQSGLLVRSPFDGANTAALRGVTLDTAIHNLTFDAASVDNMDRMRRLADDVLGSLDPLTRRVSRVLAASALLAERTTTHVSRKALAEIEAGEPVSVLLASSPTEVVVREPSEPKPGAYRPGGPVPSFAGPVDLAVGAVSAPAEEPALGIVQRLEPVKAAPAARPVPPAPVAPPQMLVSPPLTRPVSPVSPSAPLRLESATGPGAQPAIQAPAPPPVVPTASTVSTMSTVDPVDPVVPAAPVAPPTEHAPVPEAAAEPAEPAPEKLEIPVAPPKTDIRLQPTPEPEASALLPKRGVEQERTWLRKSLGQEYGLMSNGIARVLSQHPGFQGALSSSQAEVLTDAVAVQLYLSAKGVAIDAGLRTGKVGPHVPIARCVVAGLSRLPSHRGPATFTLSPTAKEWKFYRANTLFTEWGFLNMLATPSSNVPGDTDVLVWSITARRTKLLEPQQGGLADRVLFVPGTSFKLLELKEPRDGGRGLILLRELTASEVDESGRVDPNRISLDELALVSLRRELEVWAESDERRPIDPGAVARFAALPGLV